MIDLTTEQPLTLAEACRLVPPGRGGRRTHLSTLLRWITSGVRTAGGSVVRLEALRLGGKWVTSREALQRFAERLTPSLEDPADTPAPRTPTARRRAAERAGAELERRGI
jgi:hypothetical protein